jgi:hypothetical protein
MGSSFPQGNFSQLMNGIYELDKNFDSCFFDFVTELYIQI